MFIFSGPSSCCNWQLQAHVSSPKVWWYQVSENTRRNLYGKNKLPLMFFFTPPDNWNQNLFPSHDSWRLNFTPWLFSRITWFSNQFPFAFRVGKWKECLCRKQPLKGQYHIIWQLYKKLKGVFASKKKKKIIMV